MASKTIALSGSWEFMEYPEHARRMRDLQDGQWTACRVPSSIFTNLIDCGVIDASKLKANPEDYRWVSQRSWIYRKTFNVPADFLNGDAVFLCFDGLDTIGQIWLNGKLLRKTDNMFIRWRLDATRYLKENENHIMVKFAPAVEHSERLLHRYGQLSDQHFGDPKRAYIRKAQYQFGSVLGPALIGCGIYRDVRLEAVTNARIKDVYIRTIDCNQHYADIRIAVTIERQAAQATPLDCPMHIVGGGLDQPHSLHFSEYDNHVAIVVRIERPILWWPNGYGVQHLYTLKTDLQQNSHSIDTRQTPFGVRQIRLNRDKTTSGENFQFIINDRPIYAKGANWTPLTPWPGNQTGRDYEDFLHKAADSHFTMLRVWAGGFYEDDYFYQLCDKLGILVWQDFMFASAYYPDRTWFTNQVRKEAKQIITRLRNHPCIALWCGNNRIDNMHRQGQLGTGKKFYGKHIYHKLLPELISEYAPESEYIPTTPLASKKIKKDFNNPCSGTTHFWDVWNEYAPISQYLVNEQTAPRFVTEFGLQSYPEKDTLKTFCPPQHLSLSSITIHKHNYQFGGNNRLQRYISEYFTPPRSLDGLIYQTQVTQARAAKLFAEQLRGLNRVNHGCLIWTLNEPTGSISFSMLDYTGTAKALYYYARRFWTPLSAGLVQEASGRSEYHLLSENSKAFVVNDSPLPVTGTVKCSLVDMFGSPLDSIDIPVSISPFSQSPLLSIPKEILRSPHPASTFLHIQLISQKKTLFENSYTFMPDKYIRWPQTAIDIQIKPITQKQMELTICSKSFLKDVSIQPGWPNHQLSDNFFDLLPNQPRSVQIKNQEPVLNAQTPVKILTSAQADKL